jgi:uncharacterized membrane protein
MSSAKEAETFHAMPTFSPSLSASRRTGRSSGAQSLALTLGWTSLVIGAAELLAPRGVSRAIGARGRPSVLRALGLREIITGLGILAHRRQRTSWVRSRVAGDALDLALLGSVFFLQGRRNPNRLLATTGAVAGIALVDWVASEWMSHAEPGVAEEEKLVHLSGSIVINKPPEVVYEFWHNLENLPRFMKYLKEVRMEGERRSHWTAEAPGGVVLEWDAETTEDVPNQRIAWRSLPGGDLETSGSVTFKPAPANRGTVVRVEMEMSCHAPIARSNGFFARLMGKVPEQHLQNDLRRLRQWLETGEIARTEGQPAGRRRSISWRYDQLARL